MISVEHGGPTVAMLRSRPIDMKDLDDDLDIGITQNFANSDQGSALRNVKNARDATPDIDAYEPPGWSPPDDDEPSPHTRPVVSNKQTIVYGEETHRGCF